MKIAFLGKRHSIHAVRWVNALAERGHEMHFLSIERHGEPLHPSVKFYALPGIKPLGFFTAASSLRELLTLIQPDLLNAHYASGYGTTARLSRFRPTLLSVWGSDVYDFPFLSPLHRYLLVRNLSFADMISSTSEDMATLTRSLHSATPIEIVPFGIDAERFVPEPGKRDPEFITIGTVKSLGPKYGIDRLLNAFRMLQNRLLEQAPEAGSRLRLRIVGDGPQKRELEALAKRLGIADVTTFVGRVEHAQVPAELARLDVYVALSRQESFGVAVLEASSMAIPVVVSNTGGLPEVVVHEETGMVAQRGDALEASRYLEALVLDESRRRAMGKAGRRFVLQNYTWSASVDRMERAYRSLIDASTRAKEPTADVL